MGKLINRYSLYCILLIITKEIITKNTYKEIINMHSNYINNYIISFLLAAYRFLTNCGGRSFSNMVTIADRVDPHPAAQSSLKSGGR